MIDAHEPGSLNFTPGRPCTCAHLDDELLDAGWALNDMEDLLAAGRPANPRAADVVAETFADYFGLLLAQRMVDRSIVVRWCEWAYEHDQDVTEPVAILEQSVEGLDDLVDLFARGVVVPVSDTFALWAADRTEIPSHLVPEISSDADPDDRVIWHLRYSTRGWAEFLEASEWLVKHDVRLDEWDCPKYPLWAGATPSAERLGHA